MFEAGDTFKQNGAKGIVLNYLVTEVTESTVYFTCTFMPQDVQTVGYKPMEWMEEMISIGEFYDKNI